MARFVEEPEDAVADSTETNSEEGAGVLAGKQGKAKPRPSGSAKEKSLKSSLEQVAKFVPSEILAAYITLFSAANTIDPTNKHDQRLWFFGIAFFVGLIATWFYVAKMVTATKYKRINQVMAVLAFMVWAYAYPIGFFNELQWYNSVAAVFLLVIFTIISGAISVKPKAGNT